VLEVLSMVVQEHLPSPQPMPSERNEHKILHDLCMNPRRLDFFIPFPKLYTTM
jgi:hypothetical protein